MFSFGIHLNGSGLEDDPYGLNWATDPVSGDPYFGFDWEGTGVTVNPFGDSDLGTLWKELQAMQNCGGAGDNIPDIIATIIEIGKNDKGDPTVQAFFAKYGATLQQQLIQAELLLVYSQNIGTPPNPANAEAAMVAFGNSMLNGPLQGIRSGDPILGSMVDEITYDISAQGLAQLRTTFWVQSGSNWTFQIPAGGDYPSQDGQPINCGGTDGASIFAQYVFGDILYGGTFGDPKFAGATNDLFFMMFDEVFQSSKDPIYLFMALMIMFGMMKDEDYQDQLQGYSWISNWLSKHQSDLQKLLTEFTTPNFFTDAAGNPVIDPKTGVSNAVEWMDGVRKLFVGAEFNPYASSLQSNIYSSYQNVFNTNDPYTSGSTAKTIASYFWPDGSPSDPTALAKALNALSQGIPNTATPPAPSNAVPPDTVITDNFQTLTKTFTDRSQSTQTEMSGVSSNDNTVVNTLKTALDNIKQLEQQTNTAMGQANN
jgi:hypothetical protein